MPPLRADLVPLIRDRSVSMIVATIDAVRPDPVRPGPVTVETGAVVLRIADVIASPTLAKGGVIEAPYERMAQPLLRARNPANAWNSLRLTRGDTLLLACTGGPDPKAWVAVAARQVAGADAPEVGELRRAYEIERFTGTPEKKRELLSAALKQGKDLLFYYAVDAVGPRGMLPREVGIAMIADAATAAGPVQKEALGEAVSGTWAFDPARGADAGNSRALATLAGGLVAEKDVARAAVWMRLLSSCISAEFSETPAEDQRIRGALAKSFAEPSPAAIRAAIALQASGGSPDDKAIAVELLQIW